MTYPVDRSTLPPGADDLDVRGGSPRLHLTDPANVRYTAGSHAGSAIDDAIMATKRKPPKVICPGCKVEMMVKPPA